MQRLEREAVATVAAAAIAPVPVVTELPISTLRLDGGTPSQASLNTTTIAEYAEAMAAGAKSPPVVVFFDGKTRWLADGFHRVNASLKVGRVRIACDVRQGSQRDAILFSVAANATHGCLHWHTTDACLDAYSLAFAWCTGTQGATASIRSQASLARHRFQPPAADPAPVRRIGSRAIAFTIGAPVIPGGVRRARRG